MKGLNLSLSPYLSTFMEPRNRFQGIDPEESIPRNRSRGIDPEELILPGWETIPGFLERFTNSGSEPVFLPTWTGLWGEL
jgi:hypothetical protein